MSLIPRSIFDFQEAWIPGRWDPTASTWDFGQLADARFVLNVSVSPHAPQIVGTQNQSLPTTGPYIQALNSVCKTLQYRCKTSVTNFHQAAGEDFLNGVLGDLTVGQAQMGVAALTVTPSRALAFGTMYSGAQRVLQVLIHDSNVITKQSESVFVPLVRLFDPLAWLNLAVVLLAASALECATSRTGIAWLSSSANSSNCLRKLTFVVRTGLLDRSNGDHRTTLMVHSMLTAVLNLLVLITSSIISSQMMSVIAMGRLQSLPFSSLEGLIASDFIVHSSATIKASFLVDSRPLMRELGRRILTFSNTSLDTASYEVKTLESGRTAFVVWEDDGFVLAARSCNLITAIPHIDPQPITSFIFPKDSPVRPAFEARYQRLIETGLMQYHQTYYTHLFQSPEWNQCLPWGLPGPNDIRKQEPDSYTWHDIAPFCAIGLFALFLAALTFAAELIRANVLLHLPSTLRKLRPRT